MAGLDRFWWDTFLCGSPLHPDHDTFAQFRKTFLPELKGLFVQVLLLAREVGVLKLGRLSIDGTKVHADASKSKAVSWGQDRKSTRLNSSHIQKSRMPSSA